MGQLSDTLLPYMQLAFVEQLLKAILCQNRPKDFCNLCSSLDHAKNGGPIHIETLSRRWARPKGFAYSCGLRSFWPSLMRQHYTLAPTFSARERNVQFRPWVRYGLISCVYRKPKSERSGDEVRPRLRANVC